MASNENCTFSVYIFRCTFRCTFVHFPMVGLLSDQLNKCGMCYILRLHHTLCLPPAKNTNSSNLVRNSLTSLCTVSRETVCQLMVHFHIAGHICLSLTICC